MIREATQQDIYALSELANHFCETTKFLRGFNFPLFVKSWMKLISGPGVILLAESTRGLDGAIGGVAYPDINSGRLLAVEFFWMLHPAQRGSGTGIRLYRAFEKWARDQGCAEIRMIALADSMPEQLEKMYFRLGFERVEVHYAKPLTV